MSTKDSLGICIFNVDMITCDYSEWSQGKNVVDIKQKRNSSSNIWDKVKIA